jgi:hypothetical protein
MTTYKKLHGENITTLSSNPSSEDDAGRIFYNSTDNKFRSIVFTEAWSSVSPMNFGRGGMGNASATQTAGLVFGGYVDPANYYTNTEEYNGTGWAVASAKSNPTGWSMGAGTQTAALDIGGSYPGPARSTVENYNGTSWSTNPHTIPTGTYEAGSAGTSTSAIIFGGRPPATPGKANSFEYDGSSWTAGGSLNTGRRVMGGGGTQTSCRASSGVTNPSTVYVTTSEEYNGTSWSANADVNTARRDAMGTGSNADNQHFTGGWKSPGSTYSTNSEKWY